VVGVVRFVGGGRRMGMEVLVAVVVVRRRKRKTREKGQILLLFSRQ
jgi:hypothetical protein